MEKGKDKVEMILDKLRLLRVKNNQEKQAISYIILEKDIEPTLRRSLVGNVRLLETIDHLLGLLEGIGVIITKEKFKKQNKLTRNVN
jgi:hypothetical protein